MTNLIETLGRAMGQSEVTALGEQLGLSPAQTQQALAVALPVLLGQLQRNAAEPSGAQALTEAVSQDHDGSLLDNIGGYLASGGDLTDGSAILRHVLGARRSAVETGSGKAAGVDPDTMSRLMALVAPLVLAYLGRQQRQGSFGPDEMSQLLTRERDTVQRETSGEAGLRSLLDFDGSGSVTDEAIDVGRKVLGTWLAGGGDTAGS